jgi:hypothetical protein
VSVVTLAADVSASGASALPPAAAPSPAPPPSAPNAIFAEVLGNGLLYSLNYERLFPAWNVGLRAGASFLTYKISSAAGAGNLVLASWPLMVSYYFSPWGSSPHKLELGLGATVLYVAASSDSSGTKYSGSEEGLGVAASAVVGYRYWPAKRGITFGIGFTPLVRAGAGFLPWGGASGGYAF